MADVLNPDAIHQEVNRLDGWGGTTDGLTKTYHFRDETTARDFLDRVARVADELDHHPEVTHNEEHVALRLVTHSAGGVTQQDVELARAIDPLATDDPEEGHDLAED